MSKSAFKCYNKDIIQSNIHRITSIRISEVVMYDLILSLIDNLIKFDRIDTIILDNIEAKYIENLLEKLRSLSSLSSLVINSNDSVKNKHTIYRQVFRLPRLKYCKLSLPGWGDSQILPISTNEYSPIEHLIITNNVELDGLDSLLSYVPQLRRLSLDSFTHIWLSRIKLCSFVLNSVTHISLKQIDLTFDQFEQIIIDYFPMIQILYLTLNCDRDRTYIDANRWKNLIVSHLPNLRVFDIQIEITLNPTHDRFVTENQIAQFTTTFWIERQWFFTSNFYHTRYGNRLLFYSTNRYRYDLTYNPCRGERQAHVCRTRRSPHAFAYQASVRHACAYRSPRHGNNLSIMFICLEENIIHYIQNRMKIRLYNIVNLISILLNIWILKVNKV